MTKYSNGKVYTVRCKTDKTLIYVGSTIEKLCNRFSKHKYQGLKNPNVLFYSSVKDWNDWYIELYEDFPCERKEQLLKREGEIVREIGNLNMRIVGVYSNLGEKQYMKEYRDTNSEKIKDYKKENYQTNKEKILQQQKELYKLNKEMVSCSCGCNVSKHNMMRHEKSQKHINLINNQNSIKISS
jgi:hypothetical protein